MPLPATAIWSLQAISALVADQGLSRMHWTWPWKLARRTADFVEDSPSKRRFLAFASGDLAGLWADARIAASVLARRGGRRRSGGPTTRERPSRFGLQNEGS
jgi:hypothetical protein